VVHQRENKPALTRDNDSAIPDYNAIHVVPTVSLFSKRQQACAGILLLLLIFMQREADYFNFTGWCSAVADIPYIQDEKATVCFYTITTTNTRSLSMKMIFFLRTLKIAFASELRTYMVNTADNTSMAPRVSLRKCDNNP